MKNLANTNISFDFLKNSSDFLSLTLNNINSCVLLLDQHMRIHAFNDAVNTIFPLNSKEEIKMIRCGEAIGCAHQVEEMKECGQTSQCHTCDLRLSTLESYIYHKTIYKEHIVRPFFTEQGKKVNKHLQFSTRFFQFQYEKYIILIIEDITHFH